MTQYCFAESSGKPELFFGDLDDEGDQADDDLPQFGETPLLRAATAGAEGFKDRPKLRVSLTGVSWMKDSSFGAGMQSVKTLSPDDTKAEDQYLKMLEEILQIKFDMSNLEKLQPFR